MAQGLQIFNSRGQVKIDMTSRFQRLYGQFSTEGKRKGSFHDDRLAGHSIFVTPVSVSACKYSSGYSISDKLIKYRFYYPNITVDSSSGTIRWDYDFLTGFDVGKDCMVFHVNLLNGVYAHPGDFARDLSAGYIPYMQKLSEGEDVPVNTVGFMYGVYLS